MLDEVKLLGCPWCGKQPEVVRRGGVAGVRCTCGGQRFLHTYGKTVEEAIQAWNTRPGPPPEWRERVARIIDPKLELGGVTAREALAKADAIGGVFGAKTLCDEPSCASPVRNCPAADGLCGDCPPVGYSTDKTRCLPCPRRTASSPGEQRG
jgi:hypothetical protein